MTEDLKTDLVILDSATSIEAARAACKTPAFDRVNARRHELIDKMYTIGTGGCGLTPEETVELERLQEATGVVFRACRPDREDEP